MIIERLQIEEGFLDGLEINFSAGLNTIIGARGTGKTSIIELIRFCLGARSNSEEVNRESTKHVKAVLGDGRVVITFASGQEKIIVARSLDHKEPEASGVYAIPHIFSQGEIERYGLDETNRLHIVDSFAGNMSAFELQEAKVSRRIRDACSVMKQLSEKLSDLASKERNREVLQQRLLELKVEEEKLGPNSVELAAKRQTLEQVTKSTKNIDRRVAMYSDVKVTLEEWIETLGSISFLPPSNPEPDAELTPYNDIMKSMMETSLYVAKAAPTLRAHIATIDGIVKQLTGAKLNLQDQMRVIRQEIELIQEGAGTIVRQVTGLRAALAEIDALVPIRENLLQSLESHKNAREMALDELDEIRHQRFLLRKAAVDALNRRLGPKIRINLAEQAQLRDYEAKIADALRGSSLRYNEILSTITTKLSPRQLIKLVDQHAFDDFSDIIGIGLDRASRLLQQISTSGYDAILTSRVEDAVTFQLLDGGDYKGIEDISTGQRCTIMLPMILAYETNLVIDQPEDQLDNGYIVETLIKAIKDRPGSSQIIVTTHNANIPVIGDAAKVIWMKSSGRRGYKESEAPLDDRKSITAITTVMEGGREAFQYRAEFYGRHFN